MVAGVHVVILHTVMVPRAAHVPIPITVATIPITFTVPLTVVVPSLVAIHVAVTVTFPISFSISISITFLVGIARWFLALSACGGCAVLRCDFSETLFLPLQKLGKGSATAFIVLNSLELWKVFN